MERETGGELPSGSHDRLLSRPDPSHFVDVLTEGTSIYEGRRCLYRLAFYGMELPELPAELAVGRVKISQVTGPLHTQRTSVVQRPGDALVFEKHLHPLVSVGHSQPLTLLEIEEYVQRDLADQIDRLHAEATATAGMVAGLLDERLFQRPALEDLLLFDESGSELVGAIDARLRLRHFLPFPFTEHEAASLEQLGRQLHANTPEAAAARWYLKATQAGPTADGIVYMWIAIDALLGSEGERVVRAIHDRFAELDIDLSPLPLSPGRLYGIRGEIVHKGLEQPEHLRDGFYMTETLTRVLLRAALGLESSWPFQVGQASSPFKDMQQVEESWRNPLYELVDLRGDSTQ